MNEYVWKLDVEYPEEAKHAPESRELFGELNPEWSPPGWDPSPQYIERYGTDEFFWPKVERIYRTRDAAVRRAQLLERYGATVHLLRSRPLEWYIERYGTDEFFWPKVERIYRTRDAAVRRAQLLERYGATVHLLRSRPLEWEERAFPGVLSRAAKAVDA